MVGPKIAYQHFCPAARALEVIGEKWSLLIVRDLLQELEEAGIVAREAAGRREVWYSLTPKGQALAPIVTDLVVWGVEHALRPPRPGEAFHPGRATDTFVTYLNRRGVRVARPVAWVVRLPGDRAYTIRFDGERWSRERGEGPADVVVETTPEAWVTFLTSGPDERRRWLAEAGAEGTPERLDELARTLGRPEPTSDPDVAAAGDTRAVRPA
jgi:DNA-binding HxlR family transcriptional regulator